MPSSSRIMENINKKNCMGLISFCDREEIVKFNPSIKDILKFLSGLSVISGINTAKSAVSSLVGVISNKDIGSNILVKRFLNGIFNKKSKFASSFCHLECFYCTFIFENYKQ